MKRFSGDGAREALKLLSSLQAARLSRDEFLISVAEAELDHFDGQRAYQRARGRHVNSPVPGPKHPPGRRGASPRPSTRAGRRSV